MVKSAVTRNGRGVVAKEASKEYNSVKEILKVFAGVGWSVDISMEI